MALRFGRLVLVAATMLFLAGAGPVFAQSIDELQEELSSKREALKSAEARIKKFRDDVQLKRREAKSLEDQIAIIDDNIEELELSIAGTVAEIEATNAEIAALEEDISLREEEIAKEKTLLAEYLRSLYAVDQQSSVTILLKYNSFSEAVQEASTFEELQNRSRDALQHIKELKAELEQRMGDLESFRATLETLRQRQENQQATLTSNRNSKEHILSLTKQQEAQFQSLLGEAQAAHKAAEAEISKLDAAIREELRRQGRAGLPSVGVMDWPIPAIFGISCVFHCGGYPYAYLIGPHAGIDVPTYVGTPIKAPADGYVARTHDAGGPGYSYILLLHGDQVSTVYGHVSGFAVSEGQMVTRGTVIGYTGGAPGTRGAGLSSGPHLHFEVRVNNVPSDPMRYL